MKASWFPILALVTSLAACQEQSGEQTGATEETVDQAGVEESIRAMADQYEQAVLAGDTETLVSFYADDAILLAPGHPKAEGTESIRSTYQQMFAAGAPTGASLEPTTIVLAEGGDLAYEVGSFTFSGTGPDGTTMTDTGKYLVVWKPNAAGEWKIVADIWNSDAMPGAPAAEAETTTAETAPAPAGQ